MFSAEGSEISVFYPLDLRHMLIVNNFRPAQEPCPRATPSQGPNTPSQTVSHAHFQLQATKQHAISYDYCCGC